MHNEGRVRQGPAEGNSIARLTPPKEGTISAVHGFALGRIVATPNALTQIPQDDILRGLQRHQNQDWGNVDQSDRAANDQALQEGARILSSFRATTGITCWIITEADRAATTVLLPEDY